MGILKVREIKFVYARISNLDSGKAHDPVALHPGKTTAPSGPQSRIRQFREEKISYFYKQSNHDFSFVQETDMKINLQ
jgi:hypothetical protein